MSPLDTALEDHDRAIVDVGLEIWLGGEPTFTDPRSVEPHWLGAACGGDKLVRAWQILRALRRPGDLVLRTLGRQYPGEPLPRWSLGLYRLRGGQRLWEGPSDPALGEALRDAPPPGDPALANALRDAPAPVPAPPGAASSLRDAIAAALEARAFDIEGPLPYRLVTGEVDEAHLGRPPFEGRPIPETGVEDPVAEQGERLVCFGVEEGQVVLELPRFESVDLFVAFLRVVAAAASPALGALVFRGVPPPVDDRVAFTTITPDPGVIEVNMAPCASASAFAESVRAIHAAAAEAGLAASRRHYNGELTGSGGGGHLTYGGRSAEASPFFRHLQLLPRLLSFLSQHPSLSYWFAGRAVGGSGQAVRPDEQARESFDELGVALSVLERTDPSPELLWSALAPLLTDRFGNTHRSEVNVEKLCNPWLPEKGKLGVVELRAFRQGPSAAHDAARAALFRAILARLAMKAFPVGLREWGPVLHDRFALPFYLELDLVAVFRDLSDAGFGLGLELEQELRRDEHRVIGVFDLGDLRVELRRAVEFWPLVGDLSKQGGTTRLVDASTRRVEIRLRGPRAGQARVGLRVGDEAYTLPMVQHEALDSSASVFGLRYRSFRPNPGLHPSVEPMDPLVIQVDDHRIELHAWIPGGGVYAGLPEDDDQARARRAERMGIERGPALRWGSPPRHALTRYALDARRLS